MAKSTEFKNRIVELRNVKASDILPHPENWRVHPDSQRKSLTALMKNVGIADALLAFEPEPGKLMLIDGHLRREELGDTVIPVLVTDLTEDEARLVLTTLDPLAGLAGTDPLRLENLIASIETEDEEILALLKDIQDAEGLIAADMDDSGAELSDDPPVVPDGDKKIVMLYIDIDEIDTFNEQIAELGEIFELEDITDIVQEAVGRVYRGEK